MPPYNFLLDKKSISDIQRSICLVNTIAVNIEAILPRESVRAVSYTHLINEQVLDGTTGAIHYSYYLPDGYDASRKYPLVMTMPGYDMMWFGEESSGSNLNWRGFISWTELDEDLIVVSAQLTDWGETSAQQVLELTEYFIEHFAADPSSMYGRCV